MRFLTPAFVTLGMLILVGLLIAGYFVKGLFATVEKPPETLTQNVPMAVADIPAGTLVTEAHLGQGPALKEKIRSQNDTLLNNRVIINRIAKETIKAGTPIRSSQLYQPGEFPSLEVEPGYRAISISVGDSTHLVSGLVKPGQYVDVHLTPTGLSADERAGGGFTMTLFKGVRVLAINRGVRTVGQVDRTSNQVTLELTPRQSNIMIQARERGEINLSFNPQGKGTGGVVGSDDDRATFDEILGLKAPEKPQPPHAIEHYRGSGRSVMRFRNGKHLDLSYDDRYGRYGYGSGYGGWGNWNNWGGYAPGLRPAPIFWNMSAPGSGDAAGDAPPPQYNSAPAVPPSAYNLMPPVIAPTRL